MNGPEIAVAGPEIAVAIECDAWTKALPTVEELVRRVAVVALGPCSLPAERLEVSLVLGDDALVRDLNSRFRGIDKATNVLSFAALDDDEAPLPEDGPVLLGDVVVSYETTTAEAAAEGKTLGDHLSHLVVHGVLHLLGYDHEDDEEAEEMEALERSLLGTIGIVDPYEEPAEPS